MDDTNGLMVCWTEQRGTEQYVKEDPTSIECRYSMQVRPKMILRHGLVMGTAYCQLKSWFTILVAPMDGISNELRTLKAHEAYVYNGKEGGQDGQNVDTEPGDKGKD